MTSHDPHHLLHLLGWDSARDAELASYDGAVAGRVTRVDRGAVDVATADNPVRVELTGDEPAIVVGDWVALTPVPPRWQVEAVLERRSLLRRAAASGRSTAQALAANVDVVVVAVPAVPEPRLPMVERLVALAWDSGATPLVALTKTDLSSDPEGVADDVRAAAPGVEVVLVAATAPGGCDSVTAHLAAGRTFCLIGRSGAGKSTLANALLGDHRFATQAIRDDGKGRHTTTFRELATTPGGAVLVDTPGLRGVGLWVDGDGLERAFDDVESLAAGCRFSDCGHGGEPGCAVADAVADGVLPQRRLDSWHKLQREASWAAARNDARLRAERQREWKLVTLEMRRSRRSRP